MMPGRAASYWPLDPEGYDEILALRDSGRLPLGARWFTSPEPKAIATGRLLHMGRLTVVPGIEEQHRGDTWIEDPDEFRTVVRRAFADPVAPAAPGWEPLESTRDRVVTAVRGLLADDHDPEQDIVIVGHGTAFAVLAAELTGAEPNLDAWEALPLPGLWVL
jgi:broad specificity phosphatase PhoE